MVSSSDVSALFAQQQQMFASGNYFANTIGVSNPALNLGAVGWGAGAGGMRPAPGGVPGVGGPPPVFSYAGGGVFGPGYGPGNRFAGNIMSGMGAAATLGGVGLGMASMFGPLRGIAPVLDPISGFMSGYGGLSARGIMGGLMGAAPALAIGGAAAMAGGAFMQGGVQQQAISQQLGNFNFINPASRTGMGFTRQDASEIGQSIRQLAYIPDMLTSVEELTRMLPRMRQMGVMQGVRDAAEFNRRFKETVTTIREMSRMLGSTMEEASQFFEQSRLMGFTSRQSQLQNTLQAQYTSGMTGMTMGQTTGMMAGGAQQARAFGARGRFGAQGVTNIAQRIQAGLQTGAIEESLLTDVTGMEGPESVGAAAQGVYQLMMGMSQTAPGRLIMAGALRRGANGRFEIDQDVVRRLNRGEMTIDQLRARGMSLGNEAKVAFTGPEGRNLAAQFAGQVDFGSFMGRLTRGMTPGAAENVMQKLTGGSLSEPMSSLVMQMSGAGGADDMESFALRQAQERAIQERTDVGRIWERAKRAIRGGTLGPIEDMGGRAYEAIGKAYDQFVDDLVGRHIITLSKEGARAFRQAMAGDNRGLRDAIEAASGLRPGAVAPRSGSLGTFLGESDVGAWVRSIGLPGYSGRSMQGRRQEMERITGLTGSALDEALRAGGTTGAGRAAALDIGGSIAAEFNRNAALGTADADVQVAAARKALAGTVSAPFIGQSDPHTWGDRGVSIQQAILTGNSGMLQSLVAQPGETLEQAAQRMTRSKDARTQASGRVLLAGLGGKTKDLTLNAIMAAGGMKEYLNLSEAGGNVTLLAAMHREGGASAAMEEADTKLNRVFKDKANIVRSNATVRKAIDVVYGTDPAASNELNVAIARGDTARVSEILKTKVEQGDLEAMKEVMSANPDAAAAREATGHYTRVRAHSDIVAMQKRVRESGDKLLSDTNIAAGLTGDTRALVENLASSMKKFGAETDVSSLQSRLDAVRQATRALTTKLIRARPEERAAALAGVSPEIRASLEDITARGAALREGSRVTAQSIARTFGMSEADVLAIDPSLAKGAKVTADLKERLTAGAFSLALGGALTGGRMDRQVGFNEKMLSALTNIQNNSERTATLLAVMADHVQGLTDEDKKRLNAARPNADTKKTGTQ